MRKIERMLLYFLIIIFFLEIAYVKMKITKKQNLAN